MDRLAAVTVPAEQVKSARATLVTLKDVVLDALAHDVDAFLGGEASEASLRERVLELHRVDDVFDEVDSGDRLPGDPVELITTPRLLRDVLVGSLLAAVEELVATCHQYEAGKADLEQVQRKKLDADVFLDLFIGFEEHDRIAP